MKYQSKIVAATALTFSFISGPPGLYPGSSGFYQGFTQTGTSFIVRNYFEESLVDASVPGVLTSQYLVPIPSGGTSANSMINYTDNDDFGGFHLTVGSNGASGSFSSTSVDYVSNNNYTVFGTFTNFYVAGETAGYEHPAFGSSALPETSTWGMVIAGFGLIGAAARIRHRSTKVSFA